jgi:hypothetical protein
MHAQGENDHDGGWAEYYPTAFAALVASWRATFSSRAWYACSAAMIGLAALLIVPPPRARNDDADGQDPLDVPILLGAGASRTTSPGSSCSRCLLIFSVLCHHRHRMVPLALTSSAAAVLHGAVGALRPTVGQLDRHRDRAGGAARRGWVVTT